MRSDLILRGIPESPLRILELGCGNGALGAACKQIHPNAHWTGVDASADALAQAKDKLDHVVHADLNRAFISELSLSQPFDTVVIADLLERLIDPQTHLEQLLDYCTEDATLICCVPNRSHHAALMRLLSGDLSCGAGAN